MDQCNVVASRVVTDGDTLVVCDVSKIQQEIKVPLSTLVKDWKLLKLENTSKEALVLPVYMTEGTHGGGKPPRGALGDSLTLF